MTAKPEVEPRHGEANQPQGDQVTPHGQGTSPWKGTNCDVVIPCTLPADPMDIKDIQVLEPIKDGETIYARE